MDEAGIPALQDAIRHTHGCESQWIRTVPVTETHEGRVVWTGEVQVFELTNHPQAQRAYAWSHKAEGARRRFYAVLKAGSVTSAQTAVRASIMADVQAGRLKVDRAE